MDAPPPELAITKLFGSPDKDENQAMRRDHFLEEAVASWWAVEEGVELTEPEELYLYGDTVCSTPDRVESESGDVVEFRGAASWPP